MSAILAASEPAVLSANAYGKCLRAARAIAPGEVVARFAGPLVPWSEVPPEEVVYVISFEPYRWLVPRTPARYLNHSCAPSCHFRRDGTVVALRAIAAGEELTIAYDWADAADVLRHPDHFFWDPRWTFRCACGAPACRGTIDRYRPE